MRSDERHEQDYLKTKDKVQKVRVTDRVMVACEQESSTKDEVRRVIAPRE